MSILFVVPENEIDYILDELKHDNSPFPDIEKNWKASVNYRLNYIKNSESTAKILKNWKQYSIPYGHKLVINSLLSMAPVASTRVLSIVALGVISLRVLIKRLLSCRRVRSVPHGVRVGLHNVAARTTTTVLCSETCVS
jgi:hypothetical protein